MLLTNEPAKLVLPFADAGAKNTIPVPSQIGITAGAASLTDGFPPLTRTPLAAGGVPPSGLDMNGILYSMSDIIRWANSGAGYIYDSTYATDANINGYPKGARILRSDGLGYWLNTIDDNDVDPEAGGGAAAGWVPDFTHGSSLISMSGSNVTLSELEYGKPIIVISGTLTASVNLIFPDIIGKWVVVNNTTGAFDLTCKTSAGTGVIVENSQIIYGDGTNIYAVLGNYATDSLPGIVELSTDLEAQGYSDILRAITPGTLNTALKGANQSLAANGYQILPGGLILQWGFDLGSQAGVVINWPIAWPNGLLSSGGMDNTSAVYSHGIASVTTTQFTFYSSSVAAENSYWVALGY